MKQLKFILFITIALFINCANGLYIQESKVSLEKLLGRWEFIHIYNGKLTSIDTLKNKSNPSSIKLYNTYTKDGKFYQQSCNMQSGKFTIDNKSNLIKEYYDGKEEEIVNGKITYLDENYLLIVYEDDQKPLTYFYKKDKRLLTGVKSNR